MKKPRILSIGEVLWDLLPTGRVLGGAPANFALHASALGAHAQLISQVGIDELGYDILDTLETKHFDSSLIIQSATLPTGAVSVTLSEDGQPQYKIHAEVAWDHLVLTEPALQAAREADAICFGTLAQRSKTSETAIRRAIAATRPDALRILDVNLRQSFYTRELLEKSLTLATVLKLNEDELPVLSGLFGLSGDNQTQIRALADSFQLKATAFTRGALGSCLLVNGEWSELGSFPVMVKDTIGAGDSFTASFVLGLLANWPLRAIHRRAAEVSAFVCSKSGPTPDLPDYLCTSDTPLAI